MRVLTSIALLIAAALIWIGGELHRANCIDAGRAACSVLIWDGGEPHRQLPPPSGQLPPPPPPS